MRRNRSNPWESCYQFANTVTVIQVSPIKTHDPEILEAWERVSDETQSVVRAVRLPDDSWPWQIFVDAEKTIQSHPLQSQLESAVADALESALGVECIEREEPGLWVVAGATNGRELVLAVSAVVDRFLAATKVRET